MRCPGLVLIPDRHAEVCLLYHDLGLALSKNKQWLSLGQFVTSISVRVPQTHYMKGVSYCVIPKPWTSGVSDRLRSLTKNRHPTPGARHFLRR